MPEERIVRPPAPQAQPTALVTPLKSDDLTTAVPELGAPTLTINPAPPPKVEPKPEPEPPHKPD